MFNQYLNEMEEKFIQFLKDHRAYAKYARNLKKELPSFTPAQWMRVNRDTPLKWICQAFRWGLTPQGRDFWNTLNDKWEYGKP
jgi:hypothetical protein